MVLKAAKMGVLGQNLQKPLTEIDDNTLGAIEHTALYYMVHTMMPANSTNTRKIGIFLATSLAYNAVISRSMSSESSGMGR